MPRAGSVRIARTSYHVSRSKLVPAFSNRCFPTKAIRGWLASSEEGRCRIVAEYFRQSGGWDEPEIALCTPPNTASDPLYAVWAAASLTA